MLRKILLLSISALLILPILSSVSNAVIVIPPDGETGWQTYSLIIEEDWEGYVGVGVSDYGDTLFPSVLLVDNLVGMGPSGNESFELGDFTGYNMTAGTTYISTAATSTGGTVYTPTDGTYMALLNSAGGANSEVFGGSVGSWIEFYLNADAGDEISFNWNFYTTDYIPDFAFLYADESPYFIWPEGEGPDYFEILAQVGPVAVSEPCTLLLLGSGLIGLVVFRRKARKR
jgi:hypothetical protein